MATLNVQEKLALTHKRAGRIAEAEKVLLDLIERRGSTSQTFGILGRIYKDSWQRAVEAGNTLGAEALLDKAIDAYLRGFETDERDPHLGINAVALMELKAKPDPQRKQLITVVEDALERLMATRKADYWDYATRLELAVLSGNEKRVRKALGETLAAARETWEPKTTANNLKLIREARERRQEDEPWMKQLEETLEAKSKGLSTA